MASGVLLVDPRFPHNVGNCLRACALLGVESLYWTGDRVLPPEHWTHGERLPREERMKCYANTQMRSLSESRSQLEPVLARYTPVCVEISAQSEDLRDFVHPTNPLYIFGPEDGGVPKGIRTVCHRFVRIPAWEPDERTPYNLAFACGAVLYDRLCKATRPFPDSPGLVAQRGRTLTAVP